MSDFQFSLNSSTIKTTPILQKIRVAADAGYAGIELWHNDMDEHLASGGSMAEIRQCLDDHGLRVPTTIHIHDWFQPAGPEHEVAMETARRKFEQAAAVGSPFTVAGPPHGPADYETGIAHYRELLQLGREFGVRPAFEYLGFAQDICTIDDAIRVITECQDEDAALVLDPFHCHVGEGGLQSIRRLKPRQIAVSHFNDAPAEPPAARQRDPDRVMPGDGVVDLATYCRLLREIGYQGFVSLELFRPDLWEQDPLTVARIGLEKMKAASAA